MKECNLNSAWKGRKPERGEERKARSWRAVRVEGRSEGNLERKSRICPGALKAEVSWPHPSRPAGRQCVRSVSSGGRWPWDQGWLGRLHTCVSCAVSAHQLFHLQGGGPPGPPSGVGQVRASCRPEHGAEPAVSELLARGHSWDLNCPLSCSATPAFRLATRESSSPAPILQNQRHL